MNIMFNRFQTHPMSWFFDGEFNWLVLDGKVNEKSGPEDHESIYNVKATTALAFNITFGYSRHKDAAGTTHAWIAFGDHCTSQWQRELAVDLMLNLAGYRSYFKSDQPRQAWVPKQPQLLQEAEPAAALPQPLVGKGGPQANVAMSWHADEVSYCKVA